MVRRLLVRLYHGFSITMAVDIIVHLIVVRIVGTVVTPEFAARFSSEATAMLVQLLLVGVIGMAFAGAAMIFEMERWSYLKQGILHFLATAAVWMPIAWFCWTPYSGRGLALTILGWTLTYIVTWWVQYMVWKRDVCRVNRQIRACCAGEDEHEGH